MDWSGISYATQNCTDGRIVARWKAYSWRGKSPYKKSHCYLAKNLQTMISSSPIWYLHDDTAFPEPYYYRPDRWLEKDSEDSTALRNDYYIPFSKGPSTCIGNQYVAFRY